MLGGTSIPYCLSYQASLKAVRQVQLACTGRMALVYASLLCEYRKYWMLEEYCLHLCKRKCHNQMWCVDVWAQGQLCSIGEIVPGSMEIKRWIQVRCLGVYMYQAHQYISWWFNNILYCALNCNHFHQQKEQNQLVDMTYRGSILYWIKFVNVKSVGRKFGEGHLLKIDKDGHCHDNAHRKLYPKTNLSPMRQGLCKVLFFSGAGEVKYKIANIDANMGAHTRQCHWKKLHWRRGIGHEGRLRDKGWWVCLWWGCTNDKVRGNDRTMFCWASTTPLCHMQGHYIDDKQLGVHQ